MDTDQTILMDLDRWRHFTFKEKIGHITSEISRAMVWEEKGSEDNRQAALRRAMDLVDLTLQSYSGLRQREMARYREVLCHCYVRTDLYRITLKDLRHFGLMHWGL